VSLVMILYAISHLGAKQSSRYDGKQNNSCFGVVWQTQRNQWSCKQNVSKKLLKQAVNAKVKRPTGEHWIH